MVEHRRLIAILRGITPDEVVAACHELVTAGITMIEVPLNSPDAVVSIERAAIEFSGTAEIGAGTVLSTSEVEKVHQAGGRFVVSPNCDPNVIARTRALGMEAYPGVLSPTEAFAAIHAGANGLKIFPAEILGPAGIRALKAVLPPEMPVYAVGGAGPDNFQAYFKAGCVGFGLGSFLFKPGMSPTEIGAKALLAVEAFDKGHV